MGGKVLDTGSVRRWLLAPEIYYRGVRLIWDYPYDQN
jgi:hypothetical protein